MRICIGLVVLADLVIRAGDLQAHYTDEGLWPTNLIYNFGWRDGYWSLHALSGSYTHEVILFCFHICFAAGVLVGFKTRLFTVLLWLMTISLHNRNLFVLQSGDDLLRLILLWGIFLPWHAHYSVDALRRKERMPSNTAANIGYLLLLASVYFFSASLKDSAEWHSEHSAVYYALSLEQLRLPVGDLVYRSPGLMKVLTWWVFTCEYSVVPLLLFPSRQGRYRFLAFCLLLLLHIGIGLTLYVGLFFLIGIASAVGLLPKSIMDRFDRLLRIRRTYAPAPRAGNFIGRWCVNLLCALLIFLSAFVNLGTVSWFPYEMSDRLAYASNALRLTQYWGMFSPGVLKKDGWFVYHGSDSIGRQWDLRRNEDYVDYAKPARIVSMYKNDRWRKLAENMQSDRYTFLRPLFCDYLLHTWNVEHPEKQMLSLNVYFMEKENLPGYRTTMPVKTLHCICYDD